jgi:hypothetical protein
MPNCIAGAVQLRATDNAMAMGSWDIKFVLNNAASFQIQQSSQVGALVSPFRLSDFY